MSPASFARELIKVMADKKSGVTEDSLRDMILANMWRNDEWANNQIARTRTMHGCSLVVATAAFHVHRVFNETYPAFRKTANWLVRTVGNVARAGEGHVGRGVAASFVDDAYLLRDAPDRNLIGITIDQDDLFDRPSVRVQCGPWPSTLCWREPLNRRMGFGDVVGGKDALTIVKATGEIKPFTPQLAIENVTQAAARNALCMGLEDLERRGWRDVLHVHDEILIITERKREAVLAARDALIASFGPKHLMPYDWAILVKPDEISVTESIYEDEDDIKPPYVDKKTGKAGGGDRWRKIEENLVGCLENLP